MLKRLRKRRLAAPPRADDWHSGPSKVDPGRGFLVEPPQLLGQRFSTTAFRFR
jgi:hypothetical protein